MNRPTIDATTGLGLDLHPFLARLVGYLITVISTAIAMAIVFSVQAFFA